MGKGARETIIKEDNKKKIRNLFFTLLYSISRLCLPDFCQVLACRIKNLGVMLVLISLFAIFH
jgi:hypothetical protein